MGCRIALGTLAASLLSSLNAGAFVRTATQDGAYFLWWPSRSVGYYIQQDCALRPSAPDPSGNVTWNVLNAEAADAGESVLTFKDSCHAAITASFAAWQNAGPCTDLQLPYVADTPTREVGYDPKSSANMNSVLFQPALCANVLALSDPCWNEGDCDTAHADQPCFSHGADVIALTTTTYEPADGTLLDADIEINNALPGAGGFDFSAEQPGAPLPGTMDIENTVTHEAGHFIGLAHNCQMGGTPACTPILETGVMYANAPPGDVEKRTLKQDDVNAICHVYPTGLSTWFVNLQDETGASQIQVDGGFTTSCSTGAGASGWLALLALALLSRRQPTATCPGRPAR